jgi:mRNA-degrading endonuclease RelE of RelBE toxin-antitoxin system
MNYAIVTTKDFNRRIKALLKKYSSFLKDLEAFKIELLDNPTMGVELSANTRKVRMAIASKNKGKRGGARVITCHVLVNVINTKIYLLTIYDKGEQDSIDSEAIERLKRKANIP